MQATRGLLLWKYWGLQHVYSGTGLPHKCSEKHIYKIHKEKSLRADQKQNQRAASVCSRHHGRHMSSVAMCWLLNSWLPGNRSALSRVPALCWALAAAPPNARLEGSTGPALQVSCVRWGGWAMDVTAGGVSSVARGSDLSRWLSRREPSVLSIHSQVSSRLWTSCIHWI